MSPRPLEWTENSYLCEAHVPRGDQPSACTWAQCMPRASLEEPVSFPRNVFGEQVRAGWLGVKKQAHTFILKPILDSQLDQSPFCP